MKAEDGRVKVLTVVGTRPEIIRLAPTIKRLDEHTNHILVHTGQNYDYELNEVFFKDLGLRQPDHFLAADPTTLGSMLGSVLLKMERVLTDEAPDAMLVLGDTNSAISALMARRMKVPVYHMEAGNRCFDENVPEEVNRKFVDHVADYNLVYTEHARRNLLQEGVHPSRIMLTGSPMREVLSANSVAIDDSNILAKEGLNDQGYFLASIHREENVDNAERLRQILRALNNLSDQYGLPVVVSTHPRTRSRLESQSLLDTEQIHFHSPFGFHDYIKLQKSARLVLSDSGTISEEAAILGFRAVTLRDSIERPESIDTGTVITAGVSPRAILNAAAASLRDHAEQEPRSIPEEYAISDTSRRVLYFIESTWHSHHARASIRRA